MVKNLKGEEEKVSEVINYQAEIVDIKKAILPELNEEFIKKITRDRVSSEEELRKNITRRS
jgi:FKBP-type peptidyl-prolyl cis-trans isomerase (trigger factor)